MKNLLPFLNITIFSLFFSGLQAQSFSWSAFVAGSSSYETSTNGKSQKARIAGSGFLSGYPSYMYAASRGLASSIDWSDTKSTAVYSLNFSTGLSGVSFNVFDVDQSTTWDDIVTITGTDRDGRTVYPKITVPSYATVTGVNLNVIDGIANNATFTNSPATVNFGSEYVSSISITYSAGTNSPANPVAQSFAIGEISFVALLPVKLLEFNAVLTGGNTSLNWNTAEQIDLDHFEIERSVVAGGGFEYVGRVSANTDLAGHYVFTDYQIGRIGTRVYYRLKMVDKDGQFSYSPIVLVRITNAQRVTVSPTLLKSSQPLLVSLSAGANANIALYSLDGKLNSQKTNIAAGTTAIETTNLRAGMYIVRVTGMNTDKSIQIVVQ